MKQNKAETGNQSFNSSLLGDYYINSIDSLTKDNDIKNINEIKTFISSICSNEKKEEYDGTFDEYFNKMLKNEEHQKVEKLIHLIGKIGAKFPQLSESTVDALIHIVDDHMEPRVCRPAIQEMGKIGHVRESTCNKIIDEINKVTHEVIDHDVTIDAIHALYEIGLAWKKRKKYFSTFRHIKSWR